MKAKFKVGDKVVILHPSERYFGKKAIVTNVIRYESLILLTDYLVELPSGRELVFGESQLKRARKIPQKQLIINKIREIKTRRESLGYKW